MTNDELYFKLKALSLTINEAVEEMKDLLQASKEPENQFDFQSLLYLYGYYRALYHASFDLHNLKCHIFHKSY